MWMRSTSMNSTSASLASTPWSRFDATVRERVQARYIAAIAP
jgi:hypothetical protein